MSPAPPTPPIPTTERLVRVFREVFKDPTLMLSLATATKDIKGWDSFGFLTLVAAVETEFDVTFATRDLGAFDSVGRIAALLASKGVSPA